MVDTADPATPARTGGSGAAVQVLAWVQMILLSIVAPIVIYDVLTGRGVAVVPALLASAIGPALDIVITLVRSRRVDEFAVLVITFLVIGIITSLIFDDPRLLLLKESATTALFGLIALGSLVVTPRPLTHYLGRRFATGGVPESVAWFDGLWRFEGFRSTQRIMTLVWGVVLLAEAVIRGVLTYVLPIGTMVVINNIAPPVVFAALIGWTIMFGRARQRRAEAHGVDLQEPGRA